MLVFSILISTWTISEASYTLRSEPLAFYGIPTINDLAARGGYNATNYEVLTEDGYYLWLHRIGNNSGTPVLLQHGIQVAAESWIVRGRNRDLAFMLLEEGYDVWLPNERGNAYNQRHLRYKRNDPRFWDFSFHEAGYYDTPAFIDTVLDVRKLDQLYYIGHSEGTTVFLVMASMRPEYNDKILGAVLLSPIAFPPSPDELNPVIRTLSQNWELIYGTLIAAGQYEVGHRSPLSTTTIKFLCTEISIGEQACLDIIAILVGEHRENLDQKVWEDFAPIYLAGTSLKTIAHYGQVFRSGEFRQFEYGLAGNLFKYMDFQPPKYSLDLVTAPVALFWGRNDPLLSERSVDRLASKLTNMVLSKAVPDPLFSHFDMCIGSNAHLVLYPDVINILKSMTTNGSVDQGGVTS